MPGPCRAFALSLTTLLACGCGDAFAADPAAKRPLQLGLSATPAALPASRGRIGANPNARAPRFRVAQASLGERALTSLLDDAQDSAVEPASAEGASFRFNRRGNAGRDLAQGYNNLCENVSRKVWDDPKGKRVKFDVAGKPGVGIEIPLR